MTFICEKTTCDHPCDRSLAHLSDRSGKCPILEVEIPDREIPIVDTKPIPVMIIVQDGIL